MWIREYREANGMELDDFARAVNAYGRRMVPPLVCTVTDQLIHMLECVSKCVTHPNIADAIAGYCGATPEQRDSIVAPIHRGTWSLSRVVLCESDAQYVQKNFRPVFKISMSGEILAAYDSIAEAARKEKPNEDVIRKRCKRASTADFTREMPYTWRYKSEWLAMSRADQLKDIMAKGEVIGIMDQVIG